MSPVTGGDRGYPVGGYDQAVPGGAAGLDDGLVGIPSAVAQEILAKELPDVFGGIEFRGIGRQGHQGDIFGEVEPAAGLMPPGAIENEDGVGAWPNALADLRKMQVHGLGIDGGQNEGRAHAAVGTDGAEQIDRAVPLIAWRRRPGPSPRPEAGQRALLADPGFVLPPDLERLADRRGGEPLGYEPREVFLYASWAAASLRG